MHQETTQESPQICLQKEPLHGCTIQLDTSSVLQRQSSISQSKILLQKQSIISQSKIVSNTIQYLPPLIGPASAIQLMTSITSNLTDHETIGFLQNGLESIRQLKLI